VRVHHFYPKTRNIGDHFVQQGIERMIRRLVPDAAFELFNVNRRGEDGADYGLTRRAVERANRDADLIIVGGSNLYESAYRWRWGVHLDLQALEDLRVPVILLGIGTGSPFLSPPPKPSRRARREIRLLNERAILSGARDVTTRDWLRGLGVAKAELTGDPATFIFNQAARPGDRDGHVLVTLPPRRFWTSKRPFWKVRVRGRAMFRALVTLTRTLRDRGDRVVVAYNDPGDAELAHRLFAAEPHAEPVCPLSPERYFELLSGARAVVSGRLHTAVAAFSLGIPFVLLDTDQRTHGFARTYQLDGWAVSAASNDIDARLREQADRLLSGDGTPSWGELIERRERMHTRAMTLLDEALRVVSGSGRPPGRP
jgi:polysaccharide pyruvyl transferase WcaK-like protein